VKEVDYFIVIIIRHELCSDRPISTSSNSIFKDLPSRLLPLGQRHSWHLYESVQASRLFMLLKYEIYKRYPSTVIPNSQNFQTKRNAYKI
jgi:hypothetical protein